MITLRYLLKYRHQNSNVMWCVCDCMNKTCYSCTQQSRRLQHLIVNYTLHCRVLLYDIHGILTETGGSDQSVDPQQW